MRTPSYLGDLPKCTKAPFLEQVSGTSREKVKTAKNRRRKKKKKKKKKGRKKEEKDENQMIERKWMVGFTPLTSVVRVRMIERKGWFIPLEAIL